MTKDLLDQYPDICRELEDVERKLQEPVSDTVSGSGPDFPYRQHTVFIRGIPPGLAAQRDMLARQKAEVEGFIRSLPNSRLRRIVDLRAVQGLGWGQVAAKIGHRVSADAIKHQYYRIFEKI